MVPLEIQHFLENVGALQLQREAPPPCSTRLGHLTWKLDELKMKKR